jgi:hypothetical protein
MSLLTQERSGPKSISGVDYSDRYGIHLIIPSGWRVIRQNNASFPKSWSSSWLDFFCTDSMKKSEAEIVRLMERFPYCNFPNAYHCQYFLEHPYFFSDFRKNLEEETWFPFFGTIFKDSQKNRQIRYVCCNQRGKLKEGFFWPAGKEWGPKVKIPFLV